MVLGSKVGNHTKIVYGKGVFGTGFYGMIKTCKHIGSMSIRILCV